MEVVKTVLMGCGALAILTMVGCVGVVGVGSYAVDQSLRDDDGNHVLLDRAEPKGGSHRPQSADYGADPFSDYEDPDTGYDSGDSKDGWGNGAR